MSVCPARVFFKGLAKKGLIKTDPSLPFIFGIAAHEGVEALLKNGESSKVVANKYVKDNLLDKYTVKNLQEVDISTEDIQGKQAHLDKCLDNFENKIMPRLVEANPSMDWADRVEVRYEAPYRNGVMVGVIDLDMDHSVMDWKGLALDTPIPTVTGWKNMKELQVGDEIFGSNGHPCLVTAKSEIHSKKCYKITFDDKTSIICDSDHKWVTYNNITKLGNQDHTKFRRNKRTLTTEEIKDTLLDSKGKHHHRILNPGPLVLSDKQLSIDPYVLGLWLGDGSSRDSRICSADPEIFDIIKSKGYALGIPEIKTNEKTGVVTEVISIIGLQADLMSFNLLDNKHIPNEYLRGSYNQRLELLQGLMDSDGTYNQVRSQAVFCNNNANLAYGVLELVLSLGSKGRVFHVNKHGFGLTIESCDTAFTPVGFNPFKLSRKKELVKVQTMKTGNCAMSFRRLIMKIEEIASVETQCIMVDSEDSTYLCGQQMVPTHNSGKAIPYMSSLMIDPQPPTYHFLKTQTQGSAPSRFSFVYLIGKPTRQIQDGVYKSGPRKGQPKMALDYENGLQFKFDVLQDEAKVAKMFNDYIDPWAEMYEAGIIYKNPGYNGMNCKGCSYRTACQKEDYQLPKRPDLATKDPNGIDVDLLGGE